MNVAWIFRKPQSYYFSIEKVFSLVGARIQNDISIQKVYMPRHSMSLTTIFKNITFARNIKANLYHVTGDVHYVVLGLPTRKTVLTIHDSVFMYQAKGIKRKILYYLFLKWPVNKSAVVTTVSEKSRQDIIRFTNCSPDKVVVIPDPSDDRLKFVDYKYNEGCPVILFIGITPNKNLLRVIQALKGIKCQLHVIGQIPSFEKEQLQNNQIFFKESYRLSDDELMNEYIKADIVLFPSLFEGFGLPIIEAQQIGRPVITSNISPMNEVAGEGACFVDPSSVDSIREGVLKVMNDAAYRQQLVSKGVLNAQRYKPEKVAEMYLNVYQRLHN